MLLDEYGVKGIKYKDGFSRGSEGGSSNYVIFDDKIMRIAKKYGIAPAAVTSAMVASEDEAQATERLKAMSNQIPSQLQTGKGARQESQVIPVPKDREGVHAVGTWLKQNLDFPLGGTWLEGLGDYLTDLSEGQKKDAVDKYVSGLFATLDILP